MVEAADVHRFAKESIDKAAELINHDIVWGCIVCRNGPELRR
jgi:hypothetical protein